MEQRGDLPKRERADGQMSGLSGELFVAAELLKRGLQTSVTFGNAKGVDILAFNPQTGRTFTIQVKAVRTKTYFLLSHAKVDPRHVYVFVLLNKPNEAVAYFIVQGSVLSQNPERFSKWFVYPKMPGIHPKVLEEEGFKGAWEIFHQPMQGS